MADDLLKNTLTGITSQAPQTAILPRLPKPPKALTVPTPVTDNRAYIGTLAAAQKQPNAIMNLQRAMQLSSRVAYNQRQTKEMEITGRQFDPTKVSGGTFAGIIGNLEARRGFDVSKIYASTMQTYQTVQQEITRRLESLQAIEESKRRWEEEMKLRKEEIERMKEQDEELAERWEKEFDEEVRQFELNYNKKSGAATSDIKAANKYLISTAMTNFETGPDTKLDPQDFKPLASEWGDSGTGTLKDFYNEFKSLINPFDNPFSTEKEKEDYKDIYR